MLRIGPVQLETPFLLAPIAGYCDLAFRTICRRFGGVGLACTDLLSPQGLLRGSISSLDLARSNEFDKPLCMQLYGSDPAIMAEGAIWAVDHGATVVDINMGCPVDKVTKKDGGSKLLCDPDRALRLAESAARALESTAGGSGRVPLTCKLRLGWFDCAPVAETLAPRLADAGVRLVTIHGRTTEQKFSGTVNLEGIRRVVDAVAGRIPVIGNGDVREPGDALAMMNWTGCSGVMIGRGALSAPWLFRDTWATLRGLEVPSEPSLGEKVQTLRDYLALMLDFRGEHYAMVQIRRRVSWFAKRLPPSKRFREDVRLAAGPSDVESALARLESGEYFRRYPDGEQETDSADSALAGNAGASASL